MIFLAAYVLTGLVVTSGILAMARMTWPDFVRWIVEQNRQAEIEDDDDEPLSPYSVVPFVLIGFVLLWPREVFHLLTGTWRS